MLFLTYSWRFLRHVKLEQLEFKLEKNIAIQKQCKKSQKNIVVIIQDWFLTCDEQNSIHNFKKNFHFLKLFSGIHELLLGSLLTSTNAQILEKTLQILLEFWIFLDSKTLLTIPSSSYALTTPMRSCINSSTIMFLPWNKRL